MRIQQYLTLWSHLQPVMHSGIENSKNLRWNKNTKALSAQNASLNSHAIRQIRQYFLNEWANSPRSLTDAALFPGVTGHAVLTLLPHGALPALAEACLIAAGMQRAQLVAVAFWGKRERGRGMQSCKSPASESKTPTYYIHYLFQLLAKRAISN